MLKIWLRRKLLILAGVLVAATLLLYGPVTHYQFVNFDDPQYVTANIHVNSGVSLKNIAWAFSTFEMGHWHPLTWISHMMDCQLFGLNPSGHHYSNVLLHAANVVLLFLLLAKATGSTWRSLVVAALFACHPLNVESVAWVADRKTLLSAFLSFLMFAAYWWYTKRTNWIRYLVVFASFILALMAKAMAVTMPFALLLVDYWPLRRFTPAKTEADEAGPISRSTVVKLIAEKVPLLFISAASSYLAVLAQRSTGTLNTSQPVSEHLKNAAVGYLAYLEKAVVPSNLAVFYPMQETVAWSRAGVALLVLGAITALAFKLREKRYFAAGWMFFLVTLLPVIGLVQVGDQTMADRYAYTPLIGIFIVVVWGMEEICRRLSISPALVAIAGFGVVAGMAFATRTTLMYWQNSITLFTRAERVAARPNSKIEMDLAEAYNSAGRLGEAIEHYKLCETAEPINAGAFYNYGNFLAKHGQARESIAKYKMAVQLADSEWMKEASLHNLASAYLMTGDFEQAERTYTAVLKLNANHYPSMVGRGRALLGEGKFEDAANDFAQALRFRRQPQVLLSLGEALEGQRRYEQALAAYGEASNDVATAPEAAARMGALRSKLSLSSPR